MKPGIIPLILILSVLVILLIPSLQGRILPAGKTYIEEFQVPHSIIYTDNFETNITIRNDKFLPVTIQIRVDLLDGLLETITKDIGEQQKYKLSPRTTETFQITCEIQSGNIDWYKEEYNLQATLMKKRPVLGWITQDTSRVQGLHIKTPLTEKQKLRIIQVNAPEQLHQVQTMFSVNVTVQNEGEIDLNVWSQIDLVQKPSIIPELDQITIISGFVSERFELGRSKETLIKPGDSTVLQIMCQLRETEQEKNTFNIETQLYVNINGNQYLVDASPLQGIRREQSFFEEHGINVFLVLLGCLFVIFLIVLIIRIAYPAYYIKQYNLKKEKERIQRHRRFTH